MATAGRLLGGAAWLAAAEARACPLCAKSIALDPVNAGMTRGFEYITALLVLVPLLLLAGMAGWLLRSTRKKNLTGKEIPMRSTGPVLLLFLFVSLGAGCGKSAGGKSNAGGPGGGAQPAAPADGANDRWSSSVLLGVDKSKCGTVLVKALYDGQAASPAAIDMGSHPDCAAVHGDQVVYQQAEQTNPDKTVPWAFVHVSAGLKGQFGTPDKARRLDQRGCVYLPHVLGVMVGQPLFVSNSDKTSHNINARPNKNVAFNKSQAAGGPLLATQFGEPELDVHVECNVHAWMNARVHVMSHPYFVTTGLDGTGKIPFLPPGKYTLSVWHESWKAAPQEVEVQAGKQTQVTFKLSK